MNMIVGAKSDVGRVREANEDSYLVHEPLFVVADGMGGHTAGDVASSTAVEIISEGSDQASPENPDTLATLIRNANAAIYEKSSQDPSLRGMGTTCTLVLLDGAQAHIAHVGDSRAYLLRDGRLRQVTEDHTLVARMVKEGRLQPEEAEHHPQRSIITRALGVDADVEVDLDRLELREGDRLVMCSDGLSSMVDDEIIQRTALEAPDPQSAADALVQQALEAGGEDNVTVVVIDVTDKKPSRKQSRATATPVAPRRETTAPSVTSPGRRRRWPKALAATLIVLALLSVGGYFLYSYLYDKAWYVGENEEGQVAIYQGWPDPVFGVNLHDEVDTTELAVAELPETLQERVANEPSAETKADAEQIIDNLERDLRDIERERSAPIDDTGTKDATDGEDGAGQKDGAGTNGDAKDQENQ